MLTHRPVFLFVMIIAPLACMLFFTSLMREGLPTSLPAAMVDADDTPTTRKLCRVIDAMELTDIRYKYHSFSEAHKAMRRGDIYGFFYISPGTTRQALASRQPRVSFYTNDCYLVPANLLMKELKTSSELISLAIFREKLRAKGVREEDMLAWLQPIAIDFFILLILITTVYTIGYEWKQRTQRYLYALAEQSQTVAIIGKLLPQTVIYTLQFWLMDWWFFVHCGFPCHCGVGVMMLLGLLTVLASQGFGVLLFGLMAGAMLLGLLTVLASQGFGVLLFGLMAGAMRVALCICCLWGILSFSLAGFTYPVTDMHPVLQALAVWFPLRHYYLIYVNQALDGFPITCVWSSVVWLAAFCVSPLIVNYRYRKAFLQFEYMP